jgi:HK97 family phage prohead protease
MHVIKKYCDYEFIVKSDADSDYHYVEGYASTYNNTDYDNDVISPGAFTESLKSNNALKILWQHSPENPIGVGTLKDTEKGLYLNAKMPKSDDFVANRVMPQLRVGSVKSFSVGMFLKDAVRKEGKRYITKADVYETSLVTFPANPKADITNFKSFTHSKMLNIADLDTPWNAEEALKRVREFTASIDKPSLEYKSAFVSYSDSEDFTSYKSLIADVIDGELKVVPAALFAAVDTIKKSNFSEDERSVVVEYYARMGKSNPFERVCLTVDEVKKFNRRDFENCLRESGYFSKSAAVFLASKFLADGHSEYVRCEDDRELQVKELLSGLEKLKGLL